MKLLDKRFRTNVTQNTQAAKSAPTKKASKVADCPDTQTEETKDPHQRQTQAVFEEKENCQ